MPILRQSFDFWQADPAGQHEDHGKASGEYLGKYEDPDDMTVVRDGPDEKQMVDWGSLDLRTRDREELIRYIKKRDMSSREEDHSDHSVRIMTVLWWYSKAGLS